MVKTEDTAYIEGIWGYSKVVHMKKLDINICDNFHFAGHDRIGLEKVVLT